MLGGDERLLALDGHFHRAGFHHPEDAVIGIELGLGLFARRHRDPFADEIAAGEDLLAPAVLALVLGQDIGQAIDQPVGRHIGRQLGRLGGPGRDRLGRRPGGAHQRGLVGGGGRGVLRQGLFCPEEGRAGQSKGGGRDRPCVEFHLILPEPFFLKALFLSRYSGRTLAAVTRLRPAAQGRVSAGPRGGWISLKMS